MKNLTPTEKLVVLRVENAVLKHETITRYDLERELDIPMDTLKKIIPSLRRKGKLKEIRRGELYI